MHASWQRSSQHSAGYSLECSLSGKQKQLRGWSSRTIQAGTWNIFPSVRCAAEVPLSSRPWESNRTSLNPRQPQNYFWYQSGGTEIERGGYIFSGTFITDPGGSVIPAALSHVGCLSVDFGSSGPFLGMSCFNNSSAFVSRFWKPVWKYRNACVCEAAGQTLFVWK